VHKKKTTKKLYTPEERKSVNLYEAYLADSGNYITYEKAMKSDARDKNGIKEKVQLI